MPEGDKQLVGKVTHYFTNIGVAVIELSAPIAIGDDISVEGATTNFTQKVDSMQVEHKNVEKGKKGESIGMKVKDRVRSGDQVYKIA
jgi:translation elongation factor EF-1alpha